MIATITHNYTCFVVQSTILRRFSFSLCSGPVNMVLCAPRKRMHIPRVHQKFIPLQVAAAQASVVYETQSLSLRKTRRLEVSSYGQGRGGWHLRGSLVLSLAVTKWPSHTIHGQGGMKGKWVHYCLPFPGKQGFPRNPPRILFSHISLARVCHVAGLNCKGT